MRDGGGYIHTYIHAYTYICIHVSAPPVVPLDPLVPVVHRSDGGGYDGVEVPLADPDGGHVHSLGGQVDAAELVVQLQRLQLALAAVVPRRERVHVAHRLQAKRNAIQWETKHCLWKSTLTQP